MARNITVTFEDGSSHVYQNAPDDVTPAAVEARAAKEFGKRVTALDGGRAAAPAGQIPATPGLVAPPAQPSEVPIGRRIIGMVRPAVEALGSAGGGVLGAPLGPAGIVGGAGLGYGLAKGGLDVLEQQLGYQAAPTTATQAVLGGAKDVLTGATMEAGGRVAAPLLAKGAGKVVDFFRSPELKAAAIAQKSLATPSALGTDLPEVVNALRSAPPGASVAETTARIKNPAWQALLRNALERDPAGTKYLSQLREASDADALNALTRLAGGATAAETRAAVEAGRANVRAVTTPMRETALATANLGKNVADVAAAREANDLAVLMGQGAKIDPAKFVAQATGAEKALRSAGIAPLEGAPLAQQIRRAGKAPDLAANDLIEGSVNEVADQITKWTGSGGVIDAHALDAIRKNAVNAAVAKLRPGFDATAQRNAAAGVLSRIKPAIDDAIEAAGGVGYRDYLAKHADLSQKVAQKELAGKALDLWKTNKDEFVRLVQNEAPETVEKILGPGKYNIAVELADDAMKVLRTQADKRLTQLAVDTQATEGQKAITKLLQQESRRFTIPSMLSAVVSWTNKGLTELEKAIGNKATRILTESARDPNKMANLLETLPTVERSRVLRLLSDPSKWAPGAAATAVQTGAQAAKTTANMLAPDITLENALAP